MTFDDRDLSAEAALNQFGVKDQLLEKLNVKDQVFEILVGAINGNRVTNLEMIEEYVQVLDGFDGFVIDSVFMTNLRRRLTLTDDNGSNPFAGLVRDGQDFDKRPSEESEKGDEARRPEEGREEEEKEREKTKREGEEKEEEREEEQTREGMNKDEEIKKLVEEIKKEDEIYEKKKKQKPPSADESWEKIQNWLLLFAFDFSCNLVVGKIPVRGTSDLLETIKGKFLTDVIKSTKAEFMNGTYRGNRRDFLWKFVSKKTEDELLDIIKVFVVAMTVTVFTNLTWFFRLISIHTMFQKKMDIDGIGEWKNHSLLNNLSYLEACISEAIRLSPNSEVTIESLRENSKKTEKKKNDSCIAVRKEETMQDQQKMFIPGRWVDGTGCYVGLSRKEEELYSPSVKKIVHIVVKCVAIEVLSKIKMIDNSEEKMKMKWINIEKRRAKSRVIQKKREKEKLLKEMKELIKDVK